MVFTAVFLTTGREDLASYQLGYRMMFLAYILVMAAVFIAYRRISGYDLAREGETITQDSDRLTPTFWLYCLFTFLATFGLVAYSIIGFHLKAAGVFSDAAITSLYSFAMIVDAVAALIIGRAYDRFKARSGKRAADCSHWRSSPLSPSSSRCSRWAVIRRWQPPVWRCTASSSAATKR